jgi:acyl-homoserine-lactone acylase
LLVRALEIPRLSHLEYEDAPPRIERLMDALAAAYNFYLDTHASIKPRLIARFEPWQPFALMR